MSTLIRWSGDGLATGPLLLTSAGTGDTAPGFITGTTPRVELVDRRSPAIRFEATDAAPNYVGWQYSAADLYAYTTRIYFHPGGLPAPSQLALFQHTNAGETLASNWVTYRSDGKLALLDKNGVDAIVGSVVLSSVWHRIELVVNGARHELHVFVGESEVSAETLVVTLAAPVAGGRIRLWNSFGNQAGVVGWIDDFAVTDEPSLVGPVEVDFGNVYCTPADVREVLAADPRLTSDPQTAASLDDESLLQAIRDASAEIDARIGGRYTTPVVPVQESAPGSAAVYPPVIAWLSTSNAAWYATLTWRKSKDQAADDPVQKRRAAVLSVLEAASKGDIDLPLPGPVVSVDGAINLWEGSLFDYRDWLPGEVGYRGAEPGLSFRDWWDPAWGRFPF